MYIKCNFLFSGNNTGDVMFEVLTLSYQEIFSVCFLINQDYFVVYLSLCQNSLRPLLFCFALPQRMADKTDKLLPQNYNLKLCKKLYI